jgi:hypothetical protein
MAVWSIVEFAHLGEDFMLAAEHYHPAKLRTLNRLAALPGRTVGELFEEIQDTVRPGTVEGAARLYDLTDALGSLLRPGTDITEADFLSNRKRVQTGDIIVSRLRSYLKEIVVVPALPHVLLVSPEFIVLRLRPESGLTSGAWLLPYLLSEPVQTILQWSQTGSAHPRFNSDTLLAIRIPEAVIQLADNLSESVEAAHQTVASSSVLYNEAEVLLLHELGLDRLRLPTTKTYTASFVEVMAAERMDAEFYQPKYQYTLAALRKTGLTVGMVAPPVRSKFRPKPGGFFQYIEIGGVVEGGRLEPELVPMDEAPSRAQTVLEAGDVVTSSVRPLRRLTGFVSQAQTGAIGTSGFIALRPIATTPEVLTVYLRLPLICEILDLYTTASMYPTISESDVLAFPFPRLSEGAQQDISALVQKGLAARQEAMQLLAAAQRRVEEFIGNV